MNHLYKLKWIAIVLLLQAVHAEMPKILSMKKRAAVRDRWLKERVETVMPDLLRREQIDMWLIIAREYNEDPVIRTMLPATWLNARRRTILLIHDPGKDQPLETLAVSRYDVGEVFKKAWEKEKQPDQWKRLSELIAERNPKKIAVNRSIDYGLADGLASTEYEALNANLPAKYRKRIVSGEKLAVGWLETRTRSEMVVYEQICRIAHNIIKEGFSDKVIQPGVTSTDDVVWWFRERIRELKLITWFHPTVDIQRAEAGSFDFLTTFSKTERAENIIMPGDVLHVDFGITYLGLNTDTQEHAYVLRKGETEVPDYLKAALASGNRLQDILTNNFKLERTGNDVLNRSLDQAKREGIKPMIYTHPIGFHGHAAGTTIGMWDSQGGVPGHGDYPLHSNTAYSIELNAKVQIQQWGKEVAIMLEQDAFFDGETVRYIDGRQTDWIVIP
ncbi:MAG: Xaa-Pro aminopeptidase [Candidatus Marinimicrobia bacterium]|nr:Xaa-Pro aminopeptidase [Candidatus Neomarinimicrobiota bacterium]|tara:strand:+ start:701 stop:2035 length:1335 start_codon:yes stop_codon:yes gene_type:complete